MQSCSVDDNAGAQHAAPLRARSPGDYAAPDLDAAEHAALRRLVLFRRLRLALFALPFLFGGLGCLLRRTRAPLRGEHIAERNADIAEKLRRDSVRDAVSSASQRLEKVSKHMSQYDKSSSSSSASARVSEIASRALQNPQSLSAEEIKALAASVQSHQNQQNQQSQQKK